VIRYPSWTTPDVRVAVVVSGLSSQPSTIAAKPQPVSLHGAGVARVYRPKADLAGALASGVCAVHCALMPFAGAILPSAAAHVFESEWVHNLFVIVVLATSFLAFLPGWLKHGESRIWGWVTSGLALIFVARLSGSESLGLGGEALCTTAGGVLLLVAHRLNHTLAYWSERL
jgi:hypothetical protein